MSEVAKSLAAVMAELPALNKDETNKDQGFAFRSIEAITAAARPLLAKHDLVIVPTRIVAQESAEIVAKSGAKGFRSIVTVHYLFVSGKDGSTLEVEMVGEAVDYGDKSTSKAVQMAYKYALTEALMVGSGDDPDATTPEAGHTQAPPRQRRQKDETPPPDPVAEHAKVGVGQFKSWTPAQQQESFKKHSQDILKGKPTTVDEVNQVIAAMSADYWTEYPQEAPF